MTDIPDSIDGDVIATVELTDNATNENRNDIIRRLDDGNDYPGLEVQSDGDVLYVTKLE